MKHPSSPNDLSNTSEQINESWRQYKRRLFLAVGLVAFLIVFASFISVTVQVLLLLFLSTLIAVGLRGVSDLLEKYTPLGDKTALALVILGVLGFIVGALTFIGPRLAEQFAQLNSMIPDALQRLETQLGQYTWGQPLAEQIPSAVQLGQQVVFGGSDNIFTRITGVVSSALSIVSLMLIVLFSTLYLAVEPSSYVSNFLRLVPLNRRDRVHETLQGVASSLRQWLFTRLVSMALVGTLTFIGLSVLGMPLTLSLALLAALGAFIPTFGPIIALVPAVLIALTQSPQQALYVTVLYLGIQLVDNYFVSPILQKNMLYLPPAYIIATQLLFGVIAGPFGLVLAAPLAATIVVVVRMLYVEDVLEG